MRSLFLHFYPRPPRGGRLGLFLLDLIPSNISIHALREEGDKILAINPHTVKHFYPRPPRGGRPLHPDVYAECSSNFYPRPPRGGRPISAYSRSHPEYFYPRPPRGGRHGTMPASVYRFTFLSTPSARRATTAPCQRRCIASHFYPRPPRGGRLHGLKCGQQKTVISIHALREEGDCCQAIPSRSPPIISIHALREEGDSIFIPVRCSHSYFYPRPPRGGRLSKDFPRSSPKLISIHALREEGDQSR